MKSDFALNKNLPGHGQWKLDSHTQINLEMLKQRVQGTPFLNGDTQHNAYLQLSFYIHEQKNSFKVFRDGKINCNITIAPIAWNNFLEFFYHTFVTQCLEGTK